MAHYQCVWTGRVEITYPADTVPNASSLLYAISGRFHHVADFGAYSLVRRPDGSARVTFPVRVEAVIPAASEAGALAEFAHQPGLPAGAATEGFAVTEITDVAEPVAA
jgi:hypothetical protein